MLSLKTLATTVSLAAVALAAASTDNFEVIDVGNATGNVTPVTDTTAVNADGLDANANSDFDCRQACRASAQCELYYYVPSNAVGQQCFLYTDLSDLAVTEGTGLILGTPGNCGAGGAPTAPFPTTFVDAAGNPTTVAVTTCQDFAGANGASPAARMARRNAEHRERLRARAAARD